MPNKKVKRRYSKWSTDEINVIRNTSLSHRRVADAIGRTYAAVKKKRQDLGIVVKVSDIDYYSDTEIQYIKNNRHLSNPDLARLMGRSVKGLSLKRRHLRLNPPDITWSEKEVKYLLENYAIKSKKKVAEHLKRPLSSVIDKARRLGITR
ncbi:MAG: hypothetical protein LBS23_02065, partial [Holosporaceae bacterium]|nr:hypothetical protein [Holosporaceae bacterium]